MTYAPDLDAYFARIGYHGPRSATLEVLGNIVSAHVQSIPFENLDVLLGRGIDLNPEAVEAKLVHAQRGGYCFEQNSLLLHVLEALGYEVRPVSARVRLGRERDFIPARSHMFLVVQLAGERFLCDVGVGGLSPTAPLRLDTEAEQATPHEPRRIVRDGHWSHSDLRDPAARLFHQALLGDSWQDICEFTLETMHPIDREVANWFTSAHPESHFRNRLLVARATPSGRKTLLNRSFTERAGDGSTQTGTIADPETLLDHLAQHFGLRFPAGTRFACEGLDWAATE
ncbi:MAG: arylamine N-acetyltransferase [Planctomycetes bacterium]|nr:arylamine N-acetyltransferase [Planctomycetota bacterium]HPF14875.1 arylamine N-acetyltransferase [Planctomycetota bacterium]